MVDIVKWSIGTLNASTRFNAGADINSLADGSWVVDSTGAIANGTNLDVYMDVSFLLGSETSGSGSPYVGLFLLPINEDGTHYGDNASNGATIPVATYLAGTVLVPVSVSAVIYGNFRGIVLPPVDFKIGFYNKTGATTASSGHTVKATTYNLNNNG
jgi:hypothetical protein